MPNQAIIRGALVICSAMLVSSVIDLPFEYYKTVVVDEKFGFNKMTPAMIFSDLVKHSIVGIALVASILFADLWRMHGACHCLWLFLWIVWRSLYLLILARCPILMATLFKQVSLF